MAMNSTSPAVINGSTISIWMDETNQQISMTIKAKIIVAYENFPEAIKKDRKCGCRRLLVAWHSTIPCLIIDAYYSYYKNMLKLFSNIFSNNQFNLIVFLNTFICI